MAIAPAGAPVISTESGHTCTVQSQRCGVAAIGADTILLARSPWARWRQPPRGTDEAGRHLDPVAALRKGLAAVTVR